MAWVSRGKIACAIIYAVSRGHIDDPKFTIITEEVLLCIRQEKILKIEAEEHCDDGT